MLTAGECYNHVSLIQTQILTNILGFRVAELLEAFNTAYPPHLRHGHISEKIYQKLSTADGLLEVRTRVGDYLEDVQKHRDVEVTKINRLLMSLPTAIELNRKGILMHLFDRMIFSLHEIHGGRQEDDLQYEYLAIELLTNIYNINFNPRDFVSKFFGDLVNSAVINVASGGKVTNAEQLQNYLRKKSSRQSEN